MSSIDRYIAKSPQTAARTLGEETIIMSTVDSTLFSLNSTGTVIWNAADGQSTVSSIIDQKVCETFEVGPAQARNDALQFVDVLVEHGILLISDQPFENQESL